jgi:hypothetical protein
MLEQTASFCTVHDDRILDPGEIDRDHIRLPLHGKPYVADERLIQDVEDGFAVILSSLGDSFYAVLFCLYEWSHGASFVLLDFTIEKARQASSSE